MPASNKPPARKAGIEIFRLANYLKAKMGMRYAEQGGEGFLDPEKVQAADKLIADLCVDSAEVIAGHLGKLNEHWTKMRELPASKERNDIAMKIFTLAHEIKDIGSMCGYDLVAYFAESLRDYVEKTDLHVDAQRVIIQAHVDAMQTVHRQGLKDDAGPLAEELKKMVKIAISKYS